MGLFLDGLSFDMMMVVVKDSWLPTVCVRKTKGEIISYNINELSIMTLNTLLLPEGPKALRLKLE